MRRCLSKRSTVLCLQPLENRRLLAFTVNHTPYIQLGDAPLEGYNGGADQAEMIWQTTGTQDTDTFTAQVRETGTVPWTSVTLNAQINTGVNDGPGVRINHSATFVGLNFNDDYDYLITHLRGGSPIATYSSTFHTRLNSSDQSNFSFVTYGDSASGDPPTNFIAVQNQINAINPPFSLLLGDNVYSSGTHAEYDLRLDPSKNVPLTTYNKNHIDYFGFGNHDVGYLSGQAARENYSMPIPVQGVTSPAGLVFDADVQAEENYSYDYGSVHFVTFDTNNWTNTAALNKQLDWAVADISAARARANPPTWVIVFGHHPITSLGGHTEHTPDDYYYDQVLSRLGHGPGGMAVDLLLTGHAHNYQRSYPLTGHTGATANYVLDTDNNYAKGAGIPLVVQGTGGVDLGYGAGDPVFSGTYLAKAMDSSTSVAAQYGFGKVDVTPTTLTYSYVNTLGQVLDSFTIGPDLVAPTAAMTVPLDNGLNDQNPAINQVTIGAAQANFQIQLTDAIGDGVDDATVLSSAVQVTRNLLPLVAGADYTFAYDNGTNVVTLTPLPPVGASFGDGNYTITLSSAIEDLANNSLAPTTLTVVVNATLPTIVSFQDGIAGYAGTKDTYIHEDAPTANQGANVKIVSDGDDDLGTANTDAREVQGLIRFDAMFDTAGGVSRGGGPIPDGSTIISATLKLKTGGAANDQSASHFNLYRMIATWDESVNWNSMTTSGLGIARDDVEASSTITASAVGGNVNTLGGVVTFDVTADMQLWSSDNSLSTRGWVIHPDGVSLGGAVVSGETDGWRINSSEAPTIADRPILEVTYALPLTNVSAGGPYAIDEGASLVLGGSATGTGSLTYSWDVNGDSVFGDAVGAAPTLNWAQLAALGIDDGLSTRNVAVRVADGYGHQVDSISTLLTVSNLPPTAGVSGPGVILRDASPTFTLSASDPSAPDQAAGFAFAIDWGDGSAVQLVSGPSGTQVTHAFTTVGPRTVSMTATDQHGGISAAAIQNVTVTAGQLVNNAGLFDLVWTGTGGLDQVKFEQVGAGTVQVTTLKENGLNTNVIETFTGVTGRVKASGAAGDDTLDATGLTNIQATLDGQAGNNTLLGGQAGDLLVGGSNGAEGKQGSNTIIAGNGNNTIYGNAVVGAEGSTGGNNLIVGGSASDTIYGSYATVTRLNGQPSNGSEGGQNLIIGGGGSDTIYASQTADGAEGGKGSILVSGSTTLDQAALAAILSEWTSTRAYPVKIANISGTGSGSRNNGDHFLQADVTVADDAALDELFSDTHGKDNWLIYSLAFDVATRTKVTETITDLP